MSAHSASSEVSEAEEVTETFLDPGGAGPAGSNPGTADEPATGRNRGPDESASSSSRDDSTIQYDKIKPDHIRIINIDIDLQLKPNHLSVADRDAFWLGSDSLADERRKQTIIDYLTCSTGDVGPNTGFTTAAEGRHRVQLARRRRIASLAADNDMSASTAAISAMTAIADIDPASRRCNSLGDVATGAWEDGRRLRPPFPVERLRHDGESRDERQFASFSSMSEIMDNLDFQVTQRNERSHFIVTDLLIQTIEFLLADDQLVRSCVATARSSASPCRRSMGPATATGLPSSDSPDVATAARPDGSSSSADLLAALVVDEIIPLPARQASLSATLVADHSQGGASVGNSGAPTRPLPPSLEVLLKRLSRRRQHSDSGSSELTGHRRRHLQQQQQPHASNTSRLLQREQSESVFIASEGDGESESRDRDPVSDSLVRALVETCVVPIALPVGEYPELGPDLSLPAYVVTRGPRTASHASTLKQQQHRCPGCRHRFSPETARRLRLCRYYGFYFCSVCHQNTLMLVPARILASWDFSMVPVCCVARDLLKLVHAEPLFSGLHFSESLRSRLPLLWTVGRLRLQAALLMDFIDKCRQGHLLKSISAHFPVHWLSKEKPQKYSIADFQQMEFGTMPKRLRSFVSQCVEHISICPLCQAHGFLCELCRHSDIIFPFEIEKVFQCEQCNACFHRSCYFNRTGPACPKCERWRRRQLQQANEIAENHAIN